MYLFLSSPLTPVGAMLVDSGTFEWASNVPQSKSLTQSENTAQQVPEAGSAFRGAIGEAMLAHR